MSLWLPLLAGARSLLLNAQVRRLIGLYPDNSLPKLFTAAASLCALGFLVVGGHLISTSVYLVELAIPPGYDVDWRDLIGAAICISISAFLIGLPFAAASNPPLQQIQIERTNGAGDPLEGALLAHNDGVWYFFDAQGRLTAIPDDQVARVLQIEKAPDA